MKERTTLLTTTGSRAWNGFKDRSSATGEASGAFGSGVSLSGTKEAGASQDSIKASFVVGEGAMASATYNFRIWGRGGQSRNGFLITADPSSYLKVKLGLGVALGFQVETDPYGNVSVSFSVGGGLGEEVIYKPPVSVGLKYNLN